MVNINENIFKIAYSKDLDALKDAIDKQRKVGEDAEPVEAKKKEAGNNAVERMINLQFRPDFPQHITTVQEMLGGFLGIWKLNPEFFKGWTPLHFAAYGNATNVACYLLSFAGINTMLVNNSNKNFLEMDNIDKAFVQTCKFIMDSNQQKRKIEEQLQVLEICIQANQQSLQQCLRMPTEVKAATFATMFTILNTVIRGLEEKVEELKKEKDDFQQKYSVERTKNMSNSAQQNSASASGQNAANPQSSDETITEEGQASTPVSP